MPNLLTKAVAGRLSGLDEWLYVVQGGADKRFSPDSISAGAIIADPPSGSDDLAMLQEVADECFGSAASPHGLSSWLNREMVLRAGQYIVPNPVQLTSVFGGHVRGAGRFTTRITNPNGTGVLKTNGFQYGSVRHMLLVDAGDTANIFDFNWDGTGPAALQSNVFEQLYIYAGGIGLNIGAGDFMGSETELRSVFVEGAAIAGIQTSNYNALGNTMFGGNIGSCAIGVHIVSGALNIYGTGFQGSTDWDIKAVNSANDTLIVSGVRTESTNFFNGSSTRPVKLDACNQISVTSGVFAEHDGPLSIDCCVSVNGQVKPAKTRGTISNSVFGRSDWLEGSRNYTALELCNIRYGDPASFIDRQRITPAGAFNYDVTAV